MLGSIKGNERVDVMVDVLTGVRERVVLGESKSLPGDDSSHADSHHLNRCLRIAELPVQELASPQENVFIEHHVCSSVGPIQDKKIIALAPGKLCEIESEPIADRSGIAIVRIKSFHAQYGPGQRIVGSNPIKALFA